VGDQRYMLTLDIKGKFNRPEVYANERLMPLLNGLLSSHLRIASFGCVTALPGAEDQPIHLDHPPLFEATPHLTDNIPPYAVTMVVPLVDIDEQTGTTAIWEGSHKQSDDQNSEDRFELLGRLMQKPDYSMAAKPLPRQGDVYLMDYRVIHGGLANRSHIDRPILYVVFGIDLFQAAEESAEEVSRIVYLGAVLNRTAIIRLKTESTSSWSNRVVGESLECPVFRGI